MSDPSENLLSAAVHVMWEVGYTGEARAIRALSERMPGLDAEEYGEAYERAKMMDAAAWRLAVAWHASGGSTFISGDDLSSGHPGFAPGDYQEAISKNLYWASK